MAEKFVGVNELEQKMVDLESSIGETIELMKLTSNTEVVKSLKTMQILLSQIKTKVIDIEDPLYLEKSEGNVSKEVVARAVMGAFDTCGISEHDGVRYAVLKAINDVKPRKDLYREVSYTEYAKGDDVGSPNFLGLESVFRGLFGV